MEKIVLFQGVSVAKKAVNREERKNACIAAGHVKNDFLRRLTKLLQILGLN